MNKPTNWNELYEEFKQSSHHSEWYFKEFLIQKFPNGISFNDSLERQAFKAGSEYEINARSDGGLSFNPIYPSYEDYKNSLNSPKTQ